MSESPAVMLAYVCQTSKHFLPAIGMNLILRKLEIFRSQHMQDRAHLDSKNFTGLQKFAKG